MKKKLKILVLFCVILSLLLCVACGQNKSFSSDTTAEQILNAAKGAVDNLPSSEKIYDTAKNPLDTYQMSLWADGSFEECDEFSLVGDYALYYSADNSTFEISVLKASKKEDIQKLVSLLERRKETLSAGDKAAYDPQFKTLIDDSEILVEEKFVILLITPDNDDIIVAIENLKQ